MNNETLFNVFKNATVSYYNQFIASETLKT